MHDLQVIKQQITLARKNAGYTQEQMANFLGISQPAYSYYETGDKPLPLRQIRKIAEILKIPSTDLLGSDFEENTGSLKDIYFELKKMNNFLERIATVMESQ